MKFKILFPAIVLLGSFLMFSAFQKPKWKKIKPPKNFTYVPSGTLLLTPFEKEQSPKTISVQGFFMQETEVSNLEYNEFLNDLKIQGRTADYEIAKRTPENWKVEAFAKTYHVHPAYHDYPVLTISKKGAEMYCSWLKEVYQKKYGDQVEINVELPTEQEWIYAARAGRDFVPYPWGGYYLRNMKGEYLCNFKRLSEGNIHWNPETKKYEIIENDNLHDSAILPATVKSYFPNDFGLYNMCGNAAEMLSTANRTKGGSYNSTGYDIKIEAPDQYAGWTEPSQYIGFRPILHFRIK